MAGKRWYIVILGVFLLALFLIRMNIAMSTPYLSYDSYLEVRSVEHIQETGFPLRLDALRSDGASRLLRPLFSYFLAGTILLSPLMYKIIPNLFMVLALIPVYLLARKLTDSEFAALVAVILAGTGPIFFASYLVTPSAVPLVIFLILTMVYLFQDPEHHLFSLILCAIVLTFIHPLIFVLVLSLLIMMLLLRLEGFGIDGRVNELFFFTMLLSVWFYVVVYKNVLFNLGAKTIWQNLPTSYATPIFTGISTLSLMYGLGIITFLLGIFGIYYALFVGKEKTMYIVIAPIFAIASLLSLQLIPLTIGTLILTPFLAILASYGLFISKEFIEKTKFPWVQYPLMAIILFFFIFGAIIPALANANQELQQVPTKADIDSYIGLRQVLPNSAVLLTTPHEAYVVQYFANQKTVTDEDFLLVKNSNELISDIDTVYTARFTLSAIGKAEKLGATHIIFSSDAKKQYVRDRLLFDAPACMHVTQVNTLILYDLTGCMGANQ